MTNGTCNGPRKNKANSSIADWELGTDLHRDSLRGPPGRGTNKPSRPEQTVPNKANSRRAGRARRNCRWSCRLGAVRQTNPIWRDRTSLGGEICQTNPIPLAGRRSRARTPNPRGGPVRQTKPIWPHGTGILPVDANHGRDAHATICRSGDRRSRECNRAKRSQFASFRRARRTRNPPPYIGHTQEGVREAGSTWRGLGAPNAEFRTGGPIPARESSAGCRCHHCMPATPRREARWKKAKTWPRRRGTICPRRWFTIHDRPMEV
jgi:hypothetical protein